MICRSTLFVVALAFLLTSAAVAEIPAGPPRVSPMATVSQVVGASEVTIVYSRPAVRERAIWGELVPFGEVWRTGANEATTIEFTDDVKIGGKELAAGKYGLFTIPGKEEWTVIFNKVPDQWGAFNYDSEQDALRITVKPREAPFLECFLTSFTDAGADSATVSLRWAELEVAFDVAFDAQQAALAQAREFVANATPQDGRMVWNWANWCYQNKINLEEALGWASTVTQAAPMYWTHALEARLLAANGKASEAVAAAEKALEMAKAASEQPGVTADSATLAGEVGGWKSK